MSTESAKTVDHLIFQNGRWYKPTNDANDIGDYLTAWISKSELHDELFGDGANEIFAASEFGVTAGGVGDGPFYADGFGRTHLNKAFIGEHDIVAEKIEIHAKNGTWTIRKKGDVPADEPGGSGWILSLGSVAKAQKEHEQDNQGKSWIVVRCDGEIETRAYHRHSQHEAEALRQVLEDETGHEWRVFKRN